MRYPHLRDHVKAELAGDAHLDAERSARARRFHDERHNAMEVSPGSFVRVATLRARVAVLPSREACEIEATE